MGFNQGLSGLKAASTSLDVIGNNIANASTVGFKQSEAQFADVYAYALSGTVTSGQVGIGTMVTRVFQNFAQGNVAASNNAMDIAINGNGFFRFETPQGEIRYSRNGQFELTKEGHLINAAGHMLTGYSVDANGLLSTGVATPIVLSDEMVDPKITSNITMLLNLDSREAPATGTPFDPLNPATYNQATAIDVYDSLGNMHVLQTFYVKTGPAAGGSGNGTWDIYAYTDGTTLNGGNKIGTIVFDPNGHAISTPLTTSVTIPALNGAGAFTPTLDYTGSTQYGSKFNVIDNQQDGYASGRLLSFSVNEEGKIMGSYSNGETQMLGQVVLTTFMNPNGLTPIGDNEWIETLSSGAPATGAPLTGSRGMLKSHYIEESNVDLTEQLVDMITAQRVYQANAQTIKTEDQIMQTIVNLR